MYYNQKDAQRMEQLLKQAEEKLEKIREEKRNLNIDMSVEIWRDIPTVPKYEASNYGNIRHKKRKEIRTPQDNGKGYKYFAYRENGKQKNKLIHIAVAEAFIPNPDNLPQVSHLDESRDNNRADNLVWSTIEDNCNMPMRSFRLGVAKGYRVRCIETGEVYYSARQAARETNIDHSNISRCCNGIYKTAGGYHWEYI